MFLKYKGNGLWWLHASPSEKYLGKLTKQQLEKLHFNIEVALREYSESEEKH